MPEEPSIMDTYAHEDGHDISKGEHKVDASGSSLGDEARGSFATSDFHTPGGSPAVSTFDTGVGAYGVGPADGSGTSTAGSSSDTTAVYAEGEREG